MTIESLYAIYLESPSVQTDSRKVKPGDLFFALKGPSFNGNQFASQALLQGAHVAIIDEPAFKQTDRYILVDDVLSTLQALATYHRKQFTIPFIAITGSNGKTTTKELLNVVLKTRFKTYATKGNLNNHIGIPLTLLEIGRDAEMAIIEMGANHQREIEGYCKIALPTHGLITNCGKAHLEGFGGEEGVRKGKGELFDYLKGNDGVVFRNADLEYLETMASGCKKQITFGSSPADFRGFSQMEGAFVAATVTTPMNECTIHSHLVGAYNFANIMAAFAVGRTFGIAVNQIKEAIEMYRPDNSRSQMLTIGSNIVILDAYNANPSSMSEAIINFMRTDYPNKVVMIGGMMELGEDSLQEHQRIIELLEQSNWNEVVLVGGDFSKVRHGYHYFANSSEAASWYQNRQLQHCAILIKGSRAFAMERVIQGNSNV